ncbi:MAG: acyltransferase [Pseudomonadota bacterium]
MKKNNYIEPLTWLRGIAALFVIFSHSLRASNVSYSAGDTPADVGVFRALDLGDMGVTLFFVLSGLTLYLSNGAIATARDAMGFYIKRFLRIWPAFAVALLAYIAFNTYFKTQYHGPENYWIGQHVRPFSIEDIVRYLTLVFNFTGPTGLFSGALWTLPVEFQYYLAFPVALWLAAKFGPVALVVLSGVYLALGNFAFIPQSGQSMFQMAYSFFGGIFIGITMQNRQFRVHWLLTVCVSIMLITLVSLVQNKWVQLPDLPFIRSDRNLLILSSLAIVLLLFKSDFSMTPGWARRILKKYGDISYSTYLFHQLFVGATVLLFIKFNITGNIKPWLVLGVTVGGTYFVASWSYRYIERPCMEYARGLVAKKAAV